MKPSKPSLDGDLYRVLRTVNRCGGPRGYSVRLDDVAADFKRAEADGLITSCRGAWGHRLTPAGAAALGEASRLEEERTDKWNKQIEAAGFDPHKPIGSMSEAEVLQYIAWRGGLAKENA